MKPTKIKTCLSCGVEVLGFHTTKYCSACAIVEKRNYHKNYARKWRTLPKNNETQRKSNVDYRKRNPIKLMFLGAKKRAREQGVPFTITEEDVNMPEDMLCPILKIPLVLHAGTGVRGGKINSPSLDRIKPTLGYVPGNIAVISNKANRMKSDCSIEDLENILSYIKQYS